MLYAIFAGLYVSLALFIIGSFGKIIIRDRILERKIKSHWRDYRLNKILREIECL